MLEAKADVPDEILDTAEFGLGAPQHVSVEFDLLESHVEQVLNASLFLCKEITFGPCILKKFLLLLFDG